DLSAHGRQYRPSAASDIHWPGEKALSPDTTAHPPAELLPSSSSRASAAPPAREAHSHWTIWLRFPTRSADDAAESTRPETAPVAPPPPQCRRSSPSDSTPSANPAEYPHARAAVHDVAARALALAAAKPN